VSAGKLLVVFLPDGSEEQLRREVAERGDESLPAPEHLQFRETARAIVAGRSKATPFVFFAAVNLALFALAGLITAVVLLVLWLR
jgi:hypothetical protein